MEENPPTQSSRPTSREVPRSRDPRAPFGPTEQPEQPEPEAKPAERPARRSGARVAPPVTFQPPSGDAGADQPRAPRKATARPKPPTGTPAKAAKATPAKAASAKATPTKAAPIKATPTKATPTKAAPTRTTPPKAAPAKAAPAEETPLTVTPATSVGTPAEQSATASVDVEATSTTVTPEAPPSEAPLENAPWSDAAVLPAASDPVALEVSAPQAPQDAAKADETAAGGDDTSVVRAAAVRVRRTVTDTWAQVAADPARTPELLALTAVQTIGPRAAEWARRVRESYPTASADGVARLAVRQFTRRGGVSSALAAVSGVYAPAALVGAAAYHHAELVLHVAAAYGLDPADPARAVELLVLTRVHPTQDDAEAAQRAGDSATTRRLGRTLAAQAGGWAALRAVSRRFPGVSLLVTAITSHAATETLGVRAVTHYRAAVR